MCGMIYGVGVGPGDPELLTLKAAKRIRECEILALPGKEPRQTTAYRIARAAVPEAEQKQLLALDMPMTKDKAAQQKTHEAAAKLLEQYAAQGKDVVYLTLGDPTVYCTFSYVQKILERDGFAVTLISGVPSFCAAAATLGVPLALWNEPIHVLPAMHTLDAALDQPGNYVLMKSGSYMQQVKSQIKNSGRGAMMVENCGMTDERIYRTLEEIPDDAGYFSLIISKKP